MEAEGAKHRADHEGLQAGVVGDDGQRGGHGVATQGRPGQRGTRAAQVVGPLPAHAHEQHDAQLGVVGPAQRDRQRGHLTGRARGPLEVQDREQVEAELLLELLGTGAEQQAAALLVGGQHRDGQHLGAQHGVRQHVAEGELRG